MSVYIVRDYRGHVDNELEIGACYICNPSFDDFVDELLAQASAKCIPCSSSAFVSDKWLS